MFWNFCWIFYQIFIVFFIIFILSFKPAIQIIYLYFSISPKSVRFSIGLWAGSSTFSSSLSDSCIFMYDVVSDRWDSWLDTAVHILLFMLLMTLVINQLLIVWFWVFSISWTPLMHLYLWQFQLPKSLYRAFSLETHRTAHFVLI